MFTQINKQKTVNLQEHHNVTSDENIIANRLNKGFARLGLYSGKAVALRRIE